MRIAVDAMGGDNAPDAVVQGALQASREYGVDVTFVGDNELIKDRVDDFSEGMHVRIHHCDESVMMNEPPIRAVRHKRDASIRVAFELAKEGEADAVVSAGNSGATLAAAVLTLGRIQHVERPAFTSILPTDIGNVILIDVGANVDCRPHHLYQFGIMAHTFATSCLGIKDPKIGLLNIGEEGNKGNEQVRSAYELLRASSLHFVGNIEGREVFSGRVQIVVCDGFIGNVALKLSEGIAASISELLEKEFMDPAAGEPGPLFTQRVFNRLKRKLDYEEYGGAPILGIKGIGVVCHGDSNATAIKNAVRMADLYARSDIQDRLLSNMAQYQLETH